MTTRRRLLTTLSLLGVAAALPGLPSHADAPAAKPKASAPVRKIKRVGLELVLLVDGSASISEGALEFQLQGHAAAFRDPAVAEAAAMTATAVTLCSFSGPNTLRTLVPWTVIESAEAASRFATATDAAPRDDRPDSTAIGSALYGAMDLFGGAGVLGARRVIDLVSNGFSNTGIDPLAARARADTRGIGINALAILDEFDWLEGYYRETVITGPNAFVRTVDSRENFAEALRNKLILEIAGLPRMAG
ncbi:hypothetical protein M2352_001900 [Azospirillum fermentarium]|uniref:DUF1194 domain-containing protein n=1 Tax=Azospirillum fermentarium TaxID=1233114 RepID=UPI00222758D3|nr:DUF1194 domain-containing protein [Azospirillum fermentarium]MCW2246309.1 hypothetical protein [Azospirillum fermentarium]